VRLQLIALFGLAAAGAAHAGPDDAPGAHATLRIYADDDGLTVVSPAAAATAAAGEDTTVTIDAAADAISGASIDVVSSASPRPIEELRVELGLAATHALPLGDAASVSVGARGSREHDHDALGASARFRLELADRNLILDLGYQGGRDAAGDVTDPGFHRTRWTHQLAVGAARILDARTIADLVVEGTAATGYHASPYRLVPVVDPASPLAVWLDEVTPRARQSLAAAARLRRALGERWFATASYRLYADDWSITSHTAAAELRHQLGDRLLLGATVRGYAQSGAAFYRGTYVMSDAPPAERTRDRTLGPMRTLFASATGDVALDEDQRWHAIAAIGVLSSWFLDFPLQPGRDALVTTASLSLSF